MVKLGLLLPSVLFVLAAQQSPPAIPSEMQFVNVDVQVREKYTGRAISRLNATDFVILDEGKPRDVKAFQAATKPLDVLLLRFTRGSPATMLDIEDPWFQLIDVAPQLRDGDRYAVEWGNFRGARRFFEDWTGLDEAIQIPQRGFMAWSKGPSGGVQRVWIPNPGFRMLSRGERLFDAVRESADLFPRPLDRTRRRAIVAFTDDVERGSKTRPGTLIGELLEGDITLNAVILAWQGGTPQMPMSTSLVVGGGPEGNSRGAQFSASSGNRSPRPRTTLAFAPHFVENVSPNPEGASITPIVDATGGEVVPGDKFEDEFGAMLRRLRDRYVLGFYAPASDKRTFRRLEVRLSEETAKRYPNAVVRAKQGFHTQLR